MIEVDEYRLLELWSICTTAAQRLESGLSIFEAIDYAESFASRRLTTIEYAGLIRILNAWNER